MTLNLQAALAISKLVFELGAVSRITTDAHGRPESDTTHSMMLALIALHLSIEESVRLDPKMVILFALVHDLPEAKAGDTPTLRELTAEQKADKDRREAEAVEQISIELDAVRADWIVELIRQYEAQKTPEARFVRYIDKLMPRLAHLGNGARDVWTRGFDADALAEKNRIQGERLRETYPEMLLARSLLDEASRATVKILRRRDHPDRHPRRHLQHECESANLSVPERVRTSFVFDVPEVLDDDGSPPTMVRAMPCCDSGVGMSRCSPSKATKVRLYSQWDCVDFDLPPQEADVLDAVHKVLPSERVCRVHQALIAEWSEKLLDWARSMS